MPQELSRKRQREDENEGRQRKVTKTLLYNKLLVVRAFMHAVTTTTIQHGGKPHSDFPVEILKALWRTTAAFLQNLHDGLKLPTPSFSRNLEAVWPGKEFTRRYGLKETVVEALATAAAATGVEFEPSTAATATEAEYKPSTTRVNLRLRDEKEMRQTFPGSPGYELMHLVFSGNEGQYQDLVTHWWGFLTPYLEALGQK